MTNEITKTTWRDPAWIICHGRTNLNDIMAESVLVYEGRGEWNEIYPQAKAACEAWLERYFPGEWEEDDSLLRYRTKKYRPLAPVFADIDRPRKDTREKTPGDYPAGLLNIYDAVLEGDFHLATAQARTIRNQIEADNSGKTIAAKIAKAVARWDEPGNFWFRKYH